MRTEVGGRLTPECRGREPRSVILERSRKLAPTMRCPDRHDLPRFPNETGSGCYCQRRALSSSKIRKHLARGARTAVRNATNLRYARGQTQSFAGSSPRTTAPRPCGIRFLESSAQKSERAALPSTEAKRPGKKRVSILGVKATQGGRPGWLERLHGSVGFPIMSQNSTLPQSG